MNRKDYVTENLVYIRDHMRASTQPQTAAPEVEPAAPAPAPAPAAAASDSRDRAVWKRQTEANQAKRDLAERLARDLAELELELRQEEDCLSLKRRIRDDLAVQTGELQKLSADASGDGFPQAVENLRREYFRTLGQRAALNRRQTGIPTAAQPNQLQRTDLYSAAGIIAGGVTLAGIIIVIAIAAVFL